MPAIVHAISAAPGDPAFVLTWLGDEKMPEPMMEPMMRERPLRNVRDLCFSRERLLMSRGPARGAPSTLYPAAVEESGKRFDAKSNAEETEKERLWGGGRGVVS